MTDHANFSNLLGIDEHLLYTSDERAIALVDDEERHFGRLFVKRDGRVVLRTGNLGLGDPCDFKVKVKVN